MPARTHWLTAGLLSLAGHALVFAGGSQQSDSAGEPTAGVPAAVWGVTTQSVMIELDPATPVEGIIKPVERVELKPLVRTVVETVKLKADQAVMALAEEATVAEPELIEAKEPPVEATPARSKKNKKTKKPKRKQRVARASGGPVGQAAGSRGTASTASGRAAYNSYAGQVIAHLRRYKRYPPGADRNRVRGTVRLSFVVGKRGSLQSLRLTGGSGHAVLDREALSMVRRASPFPPFPSTLTQTAMTFTVPIRFKRQ